MQLSLTTLLVLLFLSIGASQSTLTLINGSSLEVKIVSETPSKIEVKKYNNLHGNSLIISKSSIHMILYQDGRIVTLNSLDQKEINKRKAIINKTVSEPLNIINFKDGFWVTRYYIRGYKVKKSKFKIAIGDNPENYKLFKEGADQRILANVIAFPSGFILGDMLGALINGSQHSFFGNRDGYNTFAILAAVVGTITVISLENKGENKMRNAVDQHNNEIPTLGLEGTTNGLGLVYRF